MVHSLLCNVLMTDKGSFGLMVPWKNDIMYAAFKVFLKGFLTNTFIVIYMLPLKTQTLTLLHTRLKVAALCFEQRLQPSKLAVCPHYLDLKNSK